MRSGRGSHHSPSILKLSELDPSKKAMRDNNASFLFKSSSIMQIGLPIRKEVAQL
jgi:hypothetical protein